MRRFLVVGHRASTSPAFSLDDLAGGAGRMDILLAAANAALLTSHGIRREAEAALLLLGPPDPPRLVRLQGWSLRHYQPDLRSNAAIVRKALEHGSRVEREITPGVVASKATLEEALDRLGPPFVYLREGGRDVRESTLPAGATFVSSDNQDLTVEEEAAVSARAPLVVGLGPVAIHTEHAIAVLQNELDRREA